MSSHFLPRLALRQSRVAVQRRAASTTSEASNAASSGATKAKEATSEAAGKAQQGLSRVTSAAGETVSRAGSAIGSTLSGIGGRTGRVISFVQSLIPPTIYYARVSGELGKVVFQGRNMSPPTMQTIQPYINTLTNAIRNPSSLTNLTVQSVGRSAEQGAKTAVNNPQNFLTRLRNLDTATLTAVGVVTAETIGFFSIGEMIGRFKIVGYRTGKGMNDAQVHH